MKSGGAYRVLVASSVVAFLLANTVLAALPKAGKAAPKPGPSRGPSPPGIEPGRTPAPGKSTAGAPTPKAPKPGSPAAKSKTPASKADSVEKHLGLSEGAATRASGPEPFTAAWYAEHPSAWQATHPHADAAAVATTAGLARFLAVPYASTTGTTVVVGEAATTQNPQPVAESQAAAQTTPAGQAEGDEQWMTIGVYEISADPTKKATRVIHLAVNPEGVVRGSHVDLVTDNVENIQGKVDKKNLHASWTIGAKGLITFRAPLNELTKPKGTVTAAFATGESESWKTAVVNSPSETQTAN